ncbi:MAG: hypothetical protein EPN39_16730 [Chitinophagaceae bacterium]|nr:MAG: hypothetical protein EPN39_16730 [Chitinophagaceae bacterium]
MKSLEEIETMLFSELQNCIGKIRSINIDLEYYNEIMGDTSFLLAALLESLLKYRDDWNQKKWIDDCLIMKAEVINNKLSICGVMIWGIENTTEQWTEPFFFEIELSQNKIDFNAYRFLFGYLNNFEIPYEEFKQNRSYWKSIPQNWKYIINRKNVKTREPT